MASLSGVLILDSVKLPKGKTGTARLSASGAAATLVLKDGKPPSEFVIFKAGVNDSDYGPIVFDEIAAAMVMQNAREKGNPYFFDFNHGMAKPYATAEEGKSAGTFVPAVNAGDLVASDCMYTAEGNDRLTSRDYNLCSPYFRWIDDEQGTRRPFELINVAFVNLAGLNGQQAIAAGSSAITATEESDMTAEEIQKLQLRADRADRLEIENEKLRGSAHDVVALGGSLQLGASATSRELTSAVTGLLALRGEIRKITGQDTDEKAVASLQAMSTKAARTEAAETRIGEIEMGALRSELDTVFDGASKEGKLTPADRQKLEASILSLQGGKVTRAAVDAAKDHVAMLSARVTVGGGGASAGAAAGARTPEQGAGGSLPPEIAKYAGRGVQLKSLEAAYARQLARREANS